MTASKHGFEAVIYNKGEMMSDFFVAVARNSFTI